MRIIGCCVGLFLWLADPGVAPAQSRLTISQPRANVAYDASPKPDYRRMTFQQELIFRRASLRAAQRSARIEARKWAGESAQRPNIRFDLPILPWYADSFRSWSARSVWISARRR